jgi:hypothetical protein
MALPQFSIELPSPLSSGKVNGLIGAAMRWLRDLLGDEGQEML